MFFEEEKLKQTYKLKMQHNGDAFFYICDMDKRNNIKTKYHDKPKEAIYSIIETLLLESTSIVRERYENIDYRIIKYIMEKQDKEIKRKKNKSTENKNETENEQKKNYEKLFQRKQQNCQLSAWLNECFKEMDKDFVYKFYEKEIQTYTQKKADSMKPKLIEIWSDKNIRNGWLKIYNP